MRLLICGVPRSGKTTAAASIILAAGIPRTPKIELRHTDDLIGQLDWSGVSAEVATWFDHAGPWIVEGVATVRAVRKWLASHFSGRPCDEIRWLGTPRVPLTPGQSAMAKACETVWDEVRPELERRGVRIVWG
jgi:adenylate kinase family enzyme